MTKSDMLRGLSAEQWGRLLRPIAIVMLSITAVAAAAYFLTGATAETVPPWLYVIFALLVVSLSATVFVMFAGLEKARRESKAGYTTTGGMYPELSQFDSRTGEVLREGGQVLTAEQREGPKTPFR